MLVSWCFAPSQQLGITSGLNTNSDLSLSYSTHKAPNIDYNNYFYSTVISSIYTHTHTHIITRISTKPQTFCITVKIFLHTKLASKYLILCRMYQSLSGSQKFSLDSHFEIMNKKIFPQNISL